MTFYISTIILTELMMIAMTLHVITYSGFNKNQKTWYILTFASIMVCALCEFFVHCGYYDVKFKIPLTIITVIQFSLAPLLGVYFTGALGMHKQAQMASYFFSLNFFVEVILAPFGLIFVFDNEGYHRGDFFIIYEVFYFISLIYLVVSMIIVGNRFRHRDFFTIAMVFVILVAGIIPMTVAKINITYTAIAICASLCYIYYNDLVQQDTKASLIQNEKKIQEMQEHMISGLANLIENRDFDTGEHVYRTSMYVKRLAECARQENIYSDEINDRFITLLCTLAPMHDIGKIVVTDSILRKPGKLTKEEYEEMKKHASLGGRVIEDVLNGVTDEDYLKFACDIVTYHHEHWDGTGYPNGLKERDIPLSARIMAIADVFDALISERCYKEPIPIDEAIKEIEKESGTHFDPELVKVFLKYKDDFITISTKSKN